MKKIKIFIELTRLNKPIGYMLLFWPCLWGLTLAFMQDTNLEKYFIYIIYFFLGSILMRSAGCITNDIVDKDFDKKVARTKNRPIASGKVSVKEGFFYIVVLCSLAFLILLQFNTLTIILGLTSIAFILSYPFMKRFTYWPQLFLGITFNWGIIMAGSSLLNTITPEIIFLYIGAIFWTLGYDTIYGYQDIKDDEIIEVKSTSIKFKNNTKSFLIICYSVFFASLIIIGILMKFSNFFYLTLLIPFWHLFFYQIKLLNTKVPENCLKLFKSNNILGLILCTNILIGKFF